MTFYVLKPEIRNEPSKNRKTGPIGIIPFGRITDCTKMNVNTKKIVKHYVNLHHNNEHTE